MPEEFESKMQCLREDPKERKKFDELQNEINDNLVILKEGGRPILELGKNKTPAAPYEELKGRLNTEEYFRYISAMVDSPEDIRKVINEPFMQWKKDKENRIYPAFQTLANAGGDCENLSFVAKRLFKDLGCRNGHNYDPRIIAVGHHAVCVYMDKDGKLYSLDQTASIKSFVSIYDASSIFADEVSNSKEEVRVSEEFLSADGKSRLDLSLDDKTLKFNDEPLTLEIWDLEYDPKKFLLDAYLPEGWKKYSEAQIYFKGKKDIVFYRKGRLFQEWLGDGTKTQYSPDLIFKKYPKEADIDEEYFDVKDSKIKQRNWKNNGKNPFRVEHFDKNGRVIQTTDWEGKVERK